MKLEKIVSMMAGLVLATACLAADGPEKAPEKTVAATGTPKITLDKMVYDFGTTSLVSQLSGTFAISNAGDGVLELKKPAPSCGCTVASLKTDKLAAGERTDLAFSVTVANISRGPIEKRITIPSNDPKSPNTVVTIKAQIVSVYEYSPLSIGLNDLRLGTTTNVTITVKRTDGKPLGVTRVDVSGTVSNVHPSLELSEGNPSTALVHVEVVADGAARRFGGSIGMYAGDSKTPVCAVPIMGRIVGDVALDRETIFWGIVDPNSWPGQQGQSIATQRVKVMSSVPDQKLELTNATSSVPEVKVSVAPIEDGKSYEIVAYVPKSPKETARGSIKVDTNFKSQPTIEIPITVNVLKRD